VNEAAILMDRPPGGWGDLVTSASLDRRFAAFEVRVDQQFEVLGHTVISTVERELRAQTWRLVTALLSSMAVLIALVGTLIALARL
jgi:hypothetical protein